MELLRSILRERQRKTKRNIYQDIRYPSLGRTECEVKNFDHSTEEFNETKKQGKLNLYEMHATVRGRYATAASQLAGRCM
jgi:hypothetical protein